MFFVVVNMKIIFHHLEVDVLSGTIVDKLIYKLWSMNYNIVI